MAINIPILVVGLGAIAVEAYIYLFSGMYQTALEGLERLVPEAAILIIAMGATRWLITHYTSQMERLDERNEKKENKFLAVLEKLEQRQANVEDETAKQRRQELSAIKDRFDAIDSHLGSQTAVLQEMVEEMREWRKAKSE